MDPTFPYRRVVVTGGAGFIGSHVCDALVSAGARVVCVDNLLTGSKENIDHLIGLSTFEMHPEWERMQMQINGEATQQALRNMDQSMAQMRARYERQSAQMQSQEESFDRIINGVDLTTDPVDGKQREVWMGTGAPHWINGLDQVVNSPTQPGPGFHQLKTQP